MNPIKLVASILCLFWVFGVTSSASEKVVVVAPFANTMEREEFEPLTTALQDVLIISLARSDSVAVVDRQKLGDLLREQKLGLQGLTDPTTAAKAGRLIGASLVVLGSFVVVDGKLRVDCRVVDVATSAILASEQVTDSPAALIQIGEQLSQRLSKTLKLKPHNLRALAADLAPTANLHFLRGLGFYYSDQHDEAIAAFTRCLRLDANHAEARFWNAKSYLAAKEWAHAKVEFHRLLADHPKHPQTAEAKKMLAVCDGNLSSEEELFFESMKDSAK